MAMRRAVLAAGVLLATVGGAAAGEIQDLLDQGYRVVGVSPGMLNDPILVLAKDNQLVACQSYFVARPQGGKACRPLK